MRPALKPGLLPVWRSRDTLQIGIDSRRAVALTGMRQAAGLLCLLDGSRDLGQVLDEARALGLDPDVADRVITLLIAGGAVADVPANSFQELPAESRNRLRPEIATAALAHGDGDGGARTLARRQGAYVRVHGTTRTGLCVAGLLTAAGVGVVANTGPAASPPPPRPAPPCPVPASPAPSGPAPSRPSPSHPAQSRPAPSVLSPSSPAPSGPAASGHGASVPSPSGSEPSGQAAEAVPTRPGRGAARQRRRPDLVVLADSARRDLPASLVLDGVPHLVMSATEAIGVVGPLVVPGRSACVRCLDMTRADRDPAWPLILAQLAVHDGEPAACDAVLAAAVASQTAAQALAFIDRGTHAVAVMSGTLELVLPGWEWKRRSWPPHPRCGCGTLRST